MQSKLRSLNFKSQIEPWTVSALIHGTFGLLVALLFLEGPHRKGRELDIEVIDAPQVTSQPIQIVQPKVQHRKVAQHEVFGVTKRAITSDQSEDVKLGNTLAKDPDHETLKPSDPDSLPIPSEDYLITKMPSLKTEARIPYPLEPKKKGIEGAVVMDLLIDAGGRVRDVSLVEGPDVDLNQAALSATKNFQFYPALIQDRPVAVRIRYAYRFVLEH